jgi:hypothetical protein
MISKPLYGSGTDWAKMKSVNNILVLMMWPMGAGRRFHRLTHPICMLITLLTTAYHMPCADPPKITVMNTPWRSKQKAHTRISVIKHTTTKTPKKAGLVGSVGQWQADLGAASVN